MEQYTYFGKYNNLYGEALHFQQDLDPAGVEVMNQQIAKEYLLKAWLTIAIEKRSGVIKIRNLFLLAKALAHDLALLRISSGVLWETIREIIEIRKNWFLNPADSAQLTALVNRYEKELFLFLKEELTGNFWLTDKNALPISRNIFIQRGNELRLRSLGLMLPAALRMQLPKGESLQRRLIRFTAEVPASKSAVPTSVTGRHAWISSAVQYNARYLPGFVPTAYGLNIFNSK